MNDDWRLRVDLFEEGVAHALREHLRASELEQDLETSLSGRVVVSVDGSVVFCYAGTQEQAEQAELLIRSLVAQRGWDAEYELKRWHPIEEDWQDPDVPLPETARTVEAEREARIEAEREEAAEQGYPDFEVRVECRSHGDCASLAQALRDDGLSVVRRWRYLLVGAADEDSAEALASRVRAQAPADSSVTVEGNLRAVYDDSPPNPFAIFGGLGG
jgi:hypothetical protein